MCKKLFIGIVAGALALTTSLAFGQSMLTKPNVFLDFSPTSGSINQTTGLGWVSQTFNAGAVVNARAYFDLELETVAPNDTGYMNEFATGTGNLDTIHGQSWEAGIPNFESIPNDIYDNFLHNNLKDTANGLDTLSDDVAMAMAWNFTVATGYSAIISFFVTDALPTQMSDFYITQADDSEPTSVYFYSTLVLREDGGPNPVPEPSTIVLLGTALAGLGLYARKRKNV